MKSNLRNRLLNVAVAVLAVAAIAMVAYRTKQWFFSDSASSVSTPIHVEHWQHIADNGQRIGPTNARVTVVMFGDFECPFCRSAATDLNRLMTEHPATIAVVFRHYPLSFHPYAMDAARSAVCGGRQGVFQPMYKLLFDKQDSLGKKSWLQFANDAGARDSIAFSTCMTDPSVDSVIRQDSIAGDALHIRGTPGLLVNDELFLGWPGYETLKRYVIKAGA